jgi:hypothetical protein
VRAAQLVSSAESVHGEKYVVDGWLSVHAQESGQCSIRTVWIIDRGMDAPRLVTAYPGKEQPFEMIKEHDRIVLTEPVPAEASK